MKIVRWIALFAGALLMCCGTGVIDLDAEGVVDVSIPEAPATEGTSEVVTLSGPPSAALVEAVVEDRPRGVAVGHALSEVELQPSFYIDCFSDLPRERRPCRHLFNRRLPETELIRRYRTRGLLDVTRLVLGRIILSEANWLHDERLDHRQPEANHAERDAPLIYQVLRYTRRSGETLLGAMRRHSPHVSEARPIPRPERHRRMVWVREIQLTCRRPAHFPARAADGGELNWDRDYRPRCLALFEFAQRLLDGDAAALGSWTSAPVITWGGRCEDAHGACDDDIAVGRGLVPFETGDTANRFWCRPGTTGCPDAPLPTEPLEEDVSNVEPELDPNVEIDPD